MADHLSKRNRSLNMAAVKSTDTKPEILVRKCVHRLGFRFRLHDQRLPGKPDLVLPRLRKVIFVHGCFWHRHMQCKRASTPATREEFWQKKFSANVERDRRVLVELKNLGWDAMVVWQCQLADTEKLSQRLLSFLMPPL